MYIILYIYICIYIYICRAVPIKWSVGQRNHFDAQIFRVQWDCGCFAQRHLWPYVPWSSYIGSMVYGHPSQISNPEKKTIYSYLVIYLPMKMDLELGIQSNYIYNLTMASNLLIPYVIPSPQLPGCHGPRAGLLVVAKLLPLSSGLDD